MTHSHPRTLLETSKLIAPVFTTPGFCNALVVLVGWVLTQGRHAVTQALVATRVAGLRHHAAFHSFFSRGTWSPDELGLVLLGKIVELCVSPGAIVELVLDDTLCRKSKPVTGYLPRGAGPLGYPLRLRSPLYAASTTKPRAAAQLCGSSSVSRRIGQPASSFSITSIK